MIPVIMMLDVDHVSVVDKIDIKMLFWEFVAIVINASNVLYTVPAFCTFFNN